MNEVIMMVIMPLITTTCTKLVDFLVNVSKMIFDHEIDI